MTDPFNITFGLTSAIGLGAGIYGAYKAFTGIERNSLKAADAEETSDEYIKIKGVNRQTNCLAILADGTIRLRDGGYLRGYLFKPKESLYFDGESVEKIYDKMAQMLRTKLPENAGLQIRCARAEDHGALISRMREEQLDIEADGGVHPTAAELKHQRMDFHKTLGASGFFNRTNHTLWIYIPMMTTADKLNNPILKAINKIGKKGFRQEIAQIFASDANLRVRLVEEEREAFEKADDFFRQATSAAPVKLAQFNFDEIRQVLYTNYNEDAISIPQFPHNPHVDLKSVLLREKIKANKNWYLLHGKTPLTIINVFNLPESNGESEGCFAGMMRPLKNSGVFRGRMTNITEYVFLDKEKNKNALKHGIKETKRNAGMGDVPDDEKAQAIAEQREAKRNLANSNKNHLKMRWYIVVYGEPATTAEELENSTQILKRDCEAIISEITNRFDGADAGLEDPEALRAIYEKTLIGNFDPRPRGREFLEEADALACFAPLEDASHGQTEKAHSLFVTTTGTLFGLNIFKHKLMSIPSVLILGETRSGKSVLASILIEDILGNIPDASCVACDYGESLKALVEMLNERYLGFYADDPKAINIWDYPDLEKAIEPSGGQIDFVVEDTLILLGINEETETGALQKSIIRKCVVEVYKSEVPRNDPAVNRRNEPTLSHLVQRLLTSEFSSLESKAEARRLGERLSVYRGSPWLDSKTDESYRTASRLTVYDLKTIGNEFPREVKRCLAYRIGAMMHRSYGKLVNGKLAPLVNVFDECHKYVDDPDLRYVMKAGETAARQGGKDYVSSIFITHRYEDIYQYKGITENIQACFVGRQNNTDALAKDRAWNRATIEAVKSLKNEKGAYSQFVLNFGKGDTQQTVGVQIYLDPVSLWGKSSEPQERNARQLLHSLFPHWSTSRIVFWLADHYPRGLVNAGLEKIDESFLTKARIEDLREREELERIQRELALLNPAVVLEEPEISFADQIGLNLEVLSITGTFRS